MKLDVKVNLKAALFGVAILTLFTAIIVKGAVIDTIERFNKTEKK